MNILKLTLTRLGVAGTMAILAIASPADDMPRDGLRGAGVPATGWYPAEVIEQRGMARFAEAWELEPCMNGATSPTGAYASRDEAEVLNDSMADNQRSGGGNTRAVPAAGGPWESRP